MRSLFTRGWDIRSLEVDARLCDRLEDAGFLYRETSECRINGEAFAADTYRGLHQDCWIFHVHFSERSYLLITVGLPVVDQSDLELSMSFLAVGLCRGVPAELPSGITEQVEALISGLKLCVA